MRFDFLISVEIKNDGLTRDSTDEDLTAMLVSALVENGTNDLPWVLSQEVYVVTKLR